MSEPFLCEIKLVAFNFAPKGWALCNGQLMPINQNQAAFALLGTTYGGNGQVTFGLPDLRGRSPMHRGDAYSIGQMGGEVLHTISTAEMPSHTHALMASTSTGHQASPTGNALAAARGRYADSGDTLLNSATLSNVGGSQPHNNMAPYLVLNAVIALQGIFPTQS